MIKAWFMNGRTGEFSDAESLATLFRKQGPPTDARKSALERLHERFARRVEVHFAGALTDDESRPLELAALTRDALRAFANHEVLALRVPGFIGGEHCAKLVRWIIEESGTVSGWEVQGPNGKLIASDTSYGVGLPENVSLRSTELFEQYYRHAIPSIHRVRGAVPELGPIDRLRLELDELWPEGARLSTNGGHKRFTGIARIMVPDKLIDPADGIVHVDSYAGLSSSGTFSANVYLEVPEEGGELEIWPTRPTSWDFLRNHETMAMLHRYQPEPDAQARIRAILPRPATIRPSVGELIVINTGRPHAVRGFSRGRRVTMQTFIKHDGTKPLEFFV